MTQLKRIIGISLIIIVILNLVFFALKWINNFYFWVTIAVVAIAAKLIQKIK